MTNDEDVRPLSLPDLIVMAEHTADDIEMMADDVAALRHSTVESASAVELYSIGADLMIGWAKVREALTALQAYGALTRGR
jgi:hypothetical protein